MTLEQLINALIDKAVIGVLLVLATYKFNKLLEAFKFEQTHQLETFKSERAEWLETFKNQMAKKNEEAKNIRLAVADVAKKIAAGIHSIAWLCWAAKHTPNEVTEKNLRAYDEEIHLILSELVGSRVILAALDNNTHSVLSPLMDKLYQLDVQVGDAKALYATSTKEGLDALGRLHGASLQFDKELLKAVTNLGDLKDKQFK